MSTDVIFYTQLGAIFTFVLVLFGLYRLLSSQKDARIELLEEKASFLQQQLDQARLAGPDVLARSLSERVSLLEAELHRRRAENTTSEERIRETETELRTVRAQIAEFQRQLEIAENLVGDLFCPSCRAPVERRDAGGGTVYNGDYEYDVDWEDTYYECGLHLHDGTEVSPCGRSAG